MGILRPLDCSVRPLLAFHIILWFIARVTCAAACREAILPEKQFGAVSQFKPVTSFVL